MRWLAALCAVAVTIGALHLIAPASSPGVDQAARPVSAAQGFADAAAAAFTDSAVGSDPALSAEQRRAGLPDHPVTGLTSDTAAGLVQIVLPGGLGDAQHSPGGQVVYPNAGAGFDILAENTGGGTRTVARIADPGGPRMVTTFVRTPADTVMVAHTNGYLTINKATPSAETVGMFAPAETRDATGQLVPSSYVVKQLAPQLYALAEVIDPRPDTAWPVYVDPPLSVAGPGGVPQGMFDSFTNTVSSVTDTVTSAASTALSATVSGAKAVGTFVKDNPLESAMLVGGVALAVTGVGGPAGAAAIAAATVNISSAAVDIAATAMPDNQTLGMASTVLGAASMVTPQGAAKKVIREGVEQAGEQLAKHTDDVIDVAKTTPTPPTQLADEIAASAPAVGTPKPGAGTPQMSTGPPRSADDRIPLEPPPYGPVRPPTEYRPPSVSQPACTRNDCGHISENPATIYSQAHTPRTFDNKLSGIESGRSSATVHRETDKRQIRRNRSAAQDGVPSATYHHRDEDNPASTKEGGAAARIDYTPDWEGEREGRQLANTYREHHIGDGDPYDRVFRGDDGKVRCAQCAISRRHQQQQQDSATDAARTQALDNARSNGGGDRSSQQNNSTAGDNNRKTGSNLDFSPGLAMACCGRVVGVYRSF
ncbi:NucA/NucB deoxyribonuclease domain-containing protein, partial [Mycobacterium sp. NPDC003449]